MFNHLFIHSTNSWNCTKSVDITIRETEWALALIEFTIKVKGNTQDPKEPGERDLTRLGQLSLSELQEVQKTKESEHRQFKSKVKKEYGSV